MFKKIHLQVKIINNFSNYFHTKTKWEKKMDFPTLY